MLPSPSQPCWHAISRHGSMEMVKKTRQKDMARIGQDYYPNILYPKHHARICVFRSQNAPETIISPQSPSQDSKEKQVPVPFVDSWISMCWSSTKGSLHEGCEPGGTPPCGSPGGSEGPVASGFSAWVDDHWIMESPAVKSMLCNAEFLDFTWWLIGNSAVTGDIRTSVGQLGHSTLDAPGRHGAREEIPGRGWGGCQICALATEEIPEKGWCFIGIH